jgi:hypothetical protein
MRLSHSVMNACLGLAMLSPAPPLAAEKLA